MPIRSPILYPLPVLITVMSEIVPFDSTVTLTVPPTPFVVGNGDIEIS